jgi:transcriptional antiterminator NusG
VQTGKEQATCGLIARVCAEWDRDQDIDGYRLLDECFSPSFHTRHKFGQEWRDVEKLLLPGYVVAVTREPDQLARRLRQIPEFTKLLTMGETFVPLSDNDRGWIERWTAEGDRAIPMSVAYKEGDRIVVAEGPLKGMEAMITQVKRRQNLAKIEIHAGAITIRASVGLAVLPKEASRASK